MTHFCDWLPTLAGAAGCPSAAAQPWDGCDFTPLLRRQTGKLPQVRFWQRNRYQPLPRCNGAMRDGPWKLLWPMRPGGDWKDPRDTESYQHGLTAAQPLMPVAAPLPEREIGPVPDPQLFRLDTDPHEDRDLAAQHPDRVRAMNRGWDQWFAEVTADWPRMFAANTDIADHAPFVAEAPPDHQEDT
jgi:arylsulfatase A